MSYEAYFFIIYESAHSLNLIIPYSHIPGLSHIPPEPPRKLPLKQSGISIAAATGEAYRKVFEFEYVSYELSDPKTYTGVYHMGTLNCLFTLISSTILMNPLSQSWVVPRP